MPQHVNRLRWLIGTGLATGAVLLMSVTMAPAEPNVPADPATAPGTAGQWICSSRQAPGAHRPPARVAAADRPSL